jgi:exodeoxyribonuclease-3
MKIATWNINSIRKRLPILLDWLAANGPDVLCLQETKVRDSEFPLDAVRSAGYHVSYRGKSAWSGVATLTRTEPERVMHGFRPEFDEEDDRVLLTVVDNVPVLNTYVPQGHRVNTDKYAYKLRWFDRLRQFFEEQFDPGRPALWLGDLNVAPEPIDVSHPDRRMSDPDFHIDARNAYKRTVAWGFIDVFRRLYPDRVQYTYWDYYGKAFDNNWGWRIDHILATAPLAERCRAAGVDLGPRRMIDPSDHTVAWAEFDL